MTVPNAVRRAPARTAARLVARLICTRPSPIARARSLPSTRVRPDARRRPVFKMTGVPKRPWPSSTANRRALRRPAARLLAPSRPQRPPARPSARPRPLLPHAQPSRRRSSPSPLFLIFLLSLLVPLAPLAPLAHLPPPWLLWLLWLLSSLLLFYCALLLGWLCVRVHGSGVGRASALGAASLSVICSK